MAALGTRFGMIALLWLVVQMNFVTATANAATDQPNILLILVDDLGKEWIPTYDGKDVGMPNLQRLADAGIVFDNAYVNPQCTPTRVSLLTGQYPFRHGWVNHWDAPRWGHGYFDWEENPSLARALQAAGYRTAAAGKWQVNDFRVSPDAMTKHGFDEYLMWTGYETGNPPSSQRYWNPYLHSKSGSRTYQGEFSEDLFVDFIGKFIDQNQSAPWFVYYPMVLPHGPVTTTPAAPDISGTQNQFEAMIRYIDFVLGNLMKHLEQTGESEDTIVLWLSDNGTSRQFTGSLGNRLVSGAKGRTAEPGVNVPLIIHAPEVYRKNRRATRSSALVDVTDFFPTFVELANGDLPANYEIDGQSFAALLRGETNDSVREWIMAMGGGNHAEPTANGVENKFVFRDRVLRDKRFKIYIGPQPSKPVTKMVDLQEDPIESHNVLDEPDDQVRDALRRFRKAIDSFPAQDNEPRYRQREANSWDRPIRVQSQTWKH